MLEKLLPYEDDLFFFINGSHTPFFDGMMWLYSGAIVWLPLLLFLLVAFIYKKRWTEWLPIFVAIALVVLLCDQLTSGLMKPFFARYRPTHYPGLMDKVRTLYEYRGGLYGFASGHAANTFGFSAFSALLMRYKPYSILVFVCAFIISYSRIYLGVHFVSDVVVGAVSGIAIGSLVYWLYSWFLNKVLYSQKPDELLHIYSIGRKRVITIVSACYILIFSVLSLQLICLVR